MQHGMSYLHFTVLLKSAATPACQMIDHGCQLRPGLTPPVILWHQEGGTMAT